MQHMEQVTQHMAASPEITFQHEPAANTKRIWKTLDIAGSYYR